MCRSFPQSFFFYDCACAWCSSLSVCFSLFILKSPLPSGTPSPIHFSCDAVLSFSCTSPRRSGSASCRRAHLRAKCFLYVFSSACGVSLDAVPTCTSMIMGDGPASFPDILATRHPELFGDIGRPGLFLDGGNSWFSCFNVPDLIFPRYDLPCHG